MVEAGAAGVDMVGEEGASGVEVAAAAADSEAVSEAEEGLGDDGDATYFKRSRGVKASLSQFSKVFWCSKTLCILAMLMSLHSSQSL